MAPGLSQLRVYIAPSGFDVDIFNKMATDNLAKQLSCSWWWSPDDPITDDPIFEEFAAQGQSLFVISGDLGAYTGSDSTDESYPAEDGFVTAVGGTQLTTNGAGGPWESETAWNQISQGGATGGGTSDDGFSIPTWQVPVINSSNGGSPTKRNAPDVAAEAAYDNYICYGGGICQGGWGGTSFATPRWAGFMALVNQQAVANGYSPLGFLNPTIYSIGQGYNYSSDFHDITNGNNSNAKGQSYDSVVGYDLATGWGSPVGQNLINDLSIGKLISTITTVSSSAVSVPPGTMVTLTATVKPSYGSGRPTGTVAFYDYFNNVSTLLSSQTLAPSDVALYSTSSLAVGAHLLAAIYDGDPIYSASISPEVPVSVTSVGATYSISGQVTNNGHGLASVTIELSEGQSGSTVTDPAGNYSFGGLPGGVNYLVVPFLAGYSFTPNGTGFNPLTEDQTANFMASLASYPLTVIEAGPGSGIVTSSPPGINCGQSCTATFAAGALVALTAGPSSGSVFAGWSGACSGADICNVSMNGGQTVSASFFPSSTQPVVAFTPGIISTVAGNGTAGYAGDGGPASGAELYSPSGLAVDAVGNLYIADTWNNVVRKLSATTGFVSTVAGNGYGAGQGYGGYSGDGGSATGAELYHPAAVAVDASGSLYVADSQNSRIRAVNMQRSAITVAGVMIQPGNIATVAGNGIQGYSGDNGLAIGAQLFGPSAVAVDALGNIYIADTENAVVRMVSVGMPSPFVSGTPTTGYIYTIAGNGTPGNSGNGGPATNAELRDPTGVSVDTFGNLYISDTNNSLVHVVSAATTSSRNLDDIYTVAGISQPGYAGDGGPGTSAALRFPQGTAVDDAGNLYIADSANNRIRELTAATAIISTVAGNGTPGYAGDDGSAKAAEVNNPWGVTVAPSTGNFYIADPGNNRIREVNVQQASLIFGSVSVGQTSASQDITVSNVGNQTLSITQVSSSAGFNVNGTDTTCSAGTTLAPGAICTLGVEFAPVGAGSAVGSVTIVDNAPTSPQTVLLSGTGTAGTPTLTWNLATASISYGTALSTSVLDATAIVSGTPVAGSYAYTATQNGGSPQTIGVGTVLPVGMYTLSVLFTPTDTTDYTSASASNLFTVSPASVSVQLNASASNVTLGQTVTFTATLSGVVGGSGPTGSVTFYDGSTQLGTAPVSSMSGQYQAALTSNSLGVGQHTMTAQYSGDGNYNSAASNVVFVTVSPNTTPLTVSPTALLFGNQGISSMSGAKRVTLTNNTGAVVKVSSEVITGTNSSDFARSSNTCGKRLAVNASCAINIAFTPGALGVRSATLTVTDSAVNSPQAVALSGTGVLQVTLSKESLAFGNQADGSSSAAKTVALTNNTSATLAVSSVALAGPNAGEFTILSDTCGSSVGAHSSCVIGLAFGPVSPGSKTASLAIADTANDSPQSVSLTGTGLVPVVITPSSLIFAARKVGTTSAAKMVTIKNNLKINLTISVISLTGIDPGDFALAATTCGTSLAGGASCTVSITFTPTEKGGRTAVLDVVDNAISSPQTITLSGTGS